MGDDSQILLMGVVLPLFFAASLILEGMARKKRGEGGKIELVLGNVFLLLVVVAVILILGR